MSAGRPRQNSVTADKKNIRRSWWVKVMVPQAKSATATLLGLGARIAHVEASAAILPLCSRCRNNRESSTSQYPNIFCSEHCEQEFIRTALASLTLEDCIRIHGRLEKLLSFAPEPAV
jgi:hypothetical protein